MKRFTAFVFVLSVGFALSFESCSNPPTTNEPTKIDTFKYHSNFTTKFDQYEVDTSDANGNNPDQIITSSKVQVTEITVDTNMSYAGKTHVLAVRSTYNPATKPADTIYYYQESNGDLYRYNYGFDYLNSFPDLVTYVGHPISVGWVLVAKLGGKEGDKWTAVKDTIESTSFPGGVYLESQATSKPDTTIMVLGEQVQCHHVRFVITGMANMGVLITATEITDTYISSDLGATVWDFFRSVSIPGIKKVRGSSRIMTYYEK
jgi:hypothetical protein